MLLIWFNVGFQRSGTDTQFSEDKLRRVVFLYSV